MLHLEVEVIEDLDSIIELHYTSNVFPQSRSNKLKLKVSIQSFEDIDSVLRAWDEKIL